MCGPETNATNKPSQQASNKGNWFYLNFISYFVSVEMLKGKGKSFLFTNNQLILSN